ncbi:hypothetical protein OIV52_32000, partial [Burkholderia pseudomallei]|nr:hypothetical protein [Burkholderia pseudomallei]
MSLDKWVTPRRGEGGTTITLTVCRKRHERAWHVRVARAVVSVAGPHAASSIDSGGQDTAFRVEDGELWRGADSVEQLRDTMMRVKESRGRFAEAAVVPLGSESDDESDMRQAFAKWRT